MSTHERDEGTAPKSGHEPGGKFVPHRKSKAARKPAPGELLTRFFGEQAPTLLRMLIKQLLENGLLRCCDDVRVDFARKMRPLKKKWPRPIRNAAEAPPPEQSFYGLQWLRIA